MVESICGESKTTYAYDPLGRRISKETDGVVTRFYWDGDALLGDVTDDDTREWVYYPGSFEPLVMVRNEKFYLYHNEPNGCPSRLLDESGKVVWAARYDAWGKVKKLLVDEVDQPLRLQGQYFDRETGLYYNRFRYYCAEIGSFTSADPLGVFAGENTYTYAPNIFSWADPMGLSCDKVNTWNTFQKANKGKFASRAEAASAYKKLLTKQSPWPIGYSPTPSVLKPGTSFQMAMSPGQAATRPGGFGTFDNINDIDFVRNNLAVKQAWKPDIDRVVTYEVTRDLPVNLGPVGPQIDKAANAYLPGGGSQLEMLIKPAERMNYLKVVGERGIQ